MYVPRLAPSLLTSPADVEVTLSAVREVVSVSFRVRSWFQSAAAFDTPVVHGRRHFAIVVYRGVDRHVHVEVRCRSFANHMKIVDIGELELRSRSIIGRSKL